ncbi:DUF726 domain-containing protein [Moritella sp. 24]|uniref:DUF726 domain-containing protein n=1 Tax=Moritella sp. 24 TaxID=2746230 RepID=UPI001BA498EC|nr:DUF726 domain-containing protein [Moritella sp. 24]QUM76080.1 DUF726 domain-containing protein [Moritella sp. 24]
MKSLFDGAFSAGKDVKQNQVVEQAKGFLTQNNDVEFIARESSSITLVTVREGLLPSVLIINGFLSQDGEEVLDWLSVVDKVYPNNKVIHVRWNAGYFTDIVRDDGIATRDDSAADKLLEAAKLAINMTPEGVAALVGELVTDKLVGHWKKSFNETLHAGHDLAKIIQHDPCLHGSIVMGYSLGAKVACQTLNHLDANQISTCYLLAGAVSAKAEQWSSILNKHTELQLINCYSDNDDILKSADGAGMLFDHAPAGLACIENQHSEQVMNLDVSTFTFGHMNFKNEKLGSALANIKNKTMLCL